MSTTATPRRCSHQPRLSAGFSLLEVLTTLAVLAVLALAALPAAGERMERSHLQAAAESLVTDLGNARLESAQSGQTLHVSVAAGAQWCWSVSTVAGCACGVPSDCQIQRVSGAEHPGLSLTEARSVDLDPSGTALRTAVAVLESRSGERLQVELSPLGRPRVCVAASRAQAAWRLPGCSGR